MNLLCNILIISTYWMHCIQYTIEPYSVYDRMAFNIRLN